MSFKQYARDAKQRLTSGFWQEVLNRRQQDRSDAESNGRSALPQLHAHREDVRNMIFNANYDRDKQFEQKVIQLLESNQLVSNPITQLADKEYLDSLTASSKQAYLLKLANRYRQIKAQYESQHTPNPIITPIDNED
ncbi:MAG: hypothetical protein PHW00_03005 [Clostridia bacterium]|nr:hypothetical protein [Clostridia bacterium]